MTHSLMIFSGSSHRELATEIAKNSKTELGKAKIEIFPDGEIGVEICENVRGKEVFVVQSLARRPNHFLMELLLLVDALKRASAKEIVAVLPYFAYARQDRKDKGRVSISARLVADLLEKAGVEHVLALDLHTDQIQGFFNVPVDHLSARPLFVRALKEKKREPGVVVAPDVGCSRLARKYAEALEFEVAILDKKRRSANRVTRGALIGEVKGKVAVIVDDICSTGETIQMAAKVCKEEGAKEVIAVVTHALMVKGVQLEGVDQFMTSDSIPLVPDGKRRGIEIISTAPLFAEAIMRIRSGESISSLF